MLRKISVLICTVLIMTSINICSVSASKGISVKLNGELVVFSDAYPIVKDSRTLIPLRGLFEKMGYEISWDANLKAAVLSKGNSKISIRSGKKYITINNIQKTTDVAAQIIDGRMMIPLRAVADATGATVNWDANSKVAEIITDSEAEYTLQLDGYVQEYKAAIEPLSYVEDTITQLNTLNSDDSRSNVSKTKEMLQKSRELLVNAINAVEDLDGGDKFAKFQELSLENFNTQINLIDVLIAAVDGEEEYAKVSAKIGELMVKAEELNAELSKLSL